MADNKQYHHFSQSYLRFITVIKDCNKYFAMMNDIKNNVDAWNNIKGKYNSLRNKIMWFNYYRKAFKNFISVISRDLKGQYPTSVILRKGGTLILNSKDEVALFALLSVHKYVDYDYEQDLATITIEPKKSSTNRVKLYGIKQNLDAILAFDDDGTYNKLPLEEKIVIDIGACTGDTSVLFALCGAKKIIAVEPFPKNFQMLQKNIKENGLTDKIVPILGACGSHSGSIIIDPAYSSTMRSNLKEFDKGVSVPILTLEQIANENAVDDAILKLDCEGCEYDVILDANTSFLRKFSHIQIEYHSGYKNLKEKLEKSGFHILNPIIDNSTRGHILAIRT